MPTFTFWETPSAGLPIDWSDARDRLAAQERADADGSSPAT
ncbi:hypothetical protein [Streptomyces sp. GQFP]|nr:hypothetical protein [Streptomyces sp. GQFP]